MKKPVFVILHGWGLSKKTFIPLVDELTKRGYHACAYDLPGFGEAKTPPRPYTITDYAEYLQKLLKKEHIECPIFIGHSFGGRVSLRYYTLYPKNVRALILSGTPGYTPVSKGKLLLFITIAKLGKRVLAIPTLSFLSETFKKWYYYIVGAREYYRAHGPMRETFKNVVSESLVDDMKNVRVPCLLLWGESDAIVPVRIGIKMRDTISGSVFEMIEGAGHGVPFKKSKEFVDCVEKFVKNI
ncbi:MAG: alpha/beta hydrolase [Patescibacteria group bacterium]|nr:alpha/beta hydrolase [Patescibacteria group bacterium]